MTDRIKLSDGSWMTSGDLEKLYRSGTGPKLQVDADWFMSEGPGRFVTPQDFSGVVALLNGSMKLPPGRYNLVSDSREEQADYDPSALFDAEQKAMNFRLSNYWKDIGGKDHRLRSSIFGASAFRVKSGTVNVDRDGRVEIHDLEIRPLDDNFNFYIEGKPFYVQARNLYWRAINDRSGQGVGVPLEFRWQPGQTGKIFRSLIGEPPSEPVPGPHAARPKERNPSAQPNLSPINYRSDTARDVPQLQDALATGRGPAIRSAGKTMNPARARTLLEDSMMIESRAVADRMSAIQGMMPDRHSEYWSGPKAEALQQEYRDLIEVRNSDRLRGNGFSSNPEGIRTLVRSGIGADTQVDIEDKATTDRMAELQTLMADRHSDYWRGPQADALQQEYRDLIERQDRRKRRDEDVSLSTMAS